MPPMPGSLEGPEESNYLTGWDRLLFGSAKRPHGIITKQGGFFQGYTFRVFRFQAVVLLSKMIYRIERG